MTPDTSAQTGSESGLRNHRTEFVREVTTDDGDQVPPSDPSWNLFSDVVRSFEWTPGPNISTQRGLGDADPANHHKGPEEHQIAVTYDLQKWLVDGNGDPLDASYDGLMRLPGNKLPNTHTIVDREDKGAVAVNNTVNGSERRPTRIYTVGIGCHIDTISLTGDPGDQQPIAVEAEYECVQARTYQIDQPDNAMLTVSGLDADVSIILENEDASVSETLDADGTTVESFGDLDAAYLVDADGNPTGNSVDVTIEEDGGLTLAVINGAESYDDVEGDVGVVATGAGSHADPIETTYEKFIGDEVARDEAPIGMDINSFAVEVSNNTERTPREDTFGQRIHVGNRETELTATVVGENESHVNISEALSGVALDVVWHMSGGQLTIPSAVLTDPGERSIEAGSEVLELDNTFSGEGIEVSA